MTLTRALAGRVALSGGPDALGAGAVGSSSGMASRSRLDERPLRLPAGLRAVDRRSGGGRRGRRHRPPRRRRSRRSCGWRWSCSAWPTASGVVLYLVGLGAPAGRGAAPAPRRQAAPGPSAERTVGLGPAHARHPAAVRAGGPAAARPRVVWAVALVGRRASGWSGRAPTRPTAPAGSSLRSAGGGVLARRRAGAAVRVGWRALARSAGSAWPCWPRDVGVVLLLGPVDRAPLARPRRRAARAHPVRGALGDRRPPARLGAADPRPHPARRRPGRARTLARRQERELRAWLFDERPPDGEGAAATLGAALERVVTDVEDRHDVEVDLVVVGDCAMEPRLEALVAARARGRPQRRPPRRGGRGVGLRRGRAAAGHRLRARPGRGLRPRRRRAGPGRACASRSSGGWPATAAGPRCTRAPGEGTEVVLEVGRTPARESAVSVPRVFLVDDHQMFRSGVRAELGDAVEVVGEAADVESAVQGIRATDPEVVLLDVHLPGGGGQGRARDPQARAPRPRVPRPVRVRRRRGRHRRDPGRRARLRHQDDLVGRPRRRHRPGARPVRPSFFNGVSTPG